jgi:hypothetical protein
MKSQIKRGLRAGSMAQVVELKPIIPSPPEKTEKMFGDVLTFGNVLFTISLLTAA